VALANETAAAKIPTKPATPHFNKLFLACQARMLDQQPLNYR
jgi:hypothetical protein